MGVQVVGALLLIALVATTGGVLAGLGADGGDVEEDARSELTQLVDGRVGETFEARYLVQLPDVEADRLRMTVWQAGTRFRHDLDLSRPDGTEHLSVIDDGRQRVRCTLLEGASWSCSDEDDRASSEVASLLSQVVRELPGELEVRSTTIDDIEVRCFTADAGTRTDEVCLDDRGVIVRASTQTATLELVEYRETVDDAIFISPG